MSDDDSAQPTPGTPAPTTTLTPGGTVWVPGVGDTGLTPQGIAAMGGRLPSQSQIDAALAAGVPVTQYIQDTRRQEDIRVAREAATVLVTISETVGALAERPAGVTEEQWKAAKEAWAERQRQEGLAETRAISEADAAYRKAEAEAKARGQTLTETRIEFLKRVEEGVQKGLKSVPYGSAFQYKPGVPAWSVGGRIYYDWEDAQKAADKLAAKGEGERRWEADGRTFDTKGAAEDYLIKKLTVTGVPERVVSDMVRHGTDYWQVGDRWFKSEAKANRYAESQATRAEGEGPGETTTWTVAGREFKTEEAAEDYAKRLTIAGVNTDKGEVLYRNTTTDKMFWVKGDKAELKAAEDAIGPDTALGTTGISQVWTLKGVDREFKSEAAAKEYALEHKVGLVWRVPGVEREFATEAAANKFIAQGLKGIIEPGATKGWLRALHPAPQELPLVQGKRLNLEAYQAVTGHGQLARPDPQKLKELGVTAAVVIIPGLWVKDWNRLTPTERAINIGADVVAIGTFTFLRPVIRGVIGVGVKATKGLRVRAGEEFLIDAIERGAWKGGRGTGKVLIVATDEVRSAFKATEAAKGRYIGELVKEGKTATNVAKAEARLEEAKLRVGRLEKGLSGSEAEKELLRLRGNFKFAVDEVALARAALEKAQGQIVRVRRSALSGEQFKAATKYSHAVEEQGKVMVKLGESMTVAGQPGAILLVKAATNVAKAEARLKEAQLRVARLEKGLRGSEADKELLRLRGEYKLSADEAALARGALEKAQEQVVRVRQSVLSGPQARAAAVGQPGATALIEKGEALQRLARNAPALLREDMALGTYSLRARLLTGSKQDIAQLLNKRVPPKALSQVYSRRFTEITEVKTARGGAPTRTIPKGRPLIGAGGGVGIRGGEAALLLATRGMARFAPAGEPIRAVSPDVEPGGRPTPSGTPRPSPVAVPRITSRPSIQPSDKPGIRPDVRPSIRPDVRPGVRPDVRPGVRPETRPGVKPSVKPAVQPQVKPAVKPAVKPVVKPAIRFEVKPVVRPGAKPAVSPKIKTPTPTRTPVPVPVTPPPPRPRFKTPSGELPEGEFPRTVKWPQGVVDVRVDLDTGAKSFRRRARPSTESPSSGFRVLTTDNDPPKPREFKHGFVTVRVTPRDVTFRRRRKF